MGALAKILSGRLRTFLIGASITVALFLLNSHYPTLLNFIELKADDLRLYARGVKAPTGVVAIAAIDDKSVAELGRWPWPRATIAKLVAALQAYHVAVIGFDMVFSEADNADQARASIITRMREAGAPLEPLERALGPANDPALAAAIKAQGKVFIGYPLEIPDSHNRGQVNPGFLSHVVPPGPMTYGLVRLPPGPPPFLPTAIAYMPNQPVLNRAARGTAYFDTPSDPDGIFRTEMLVIRLGDRYCEPLFLALASAYAGGAMTSLTLANYGVASVRVGPIQVPVDEQGKMLVNFRGPAYTFPYYSVSDIVAHRVAANQLAGKIVLVGATALGLGDKWSTAVGSNFPGVEINADAIDNLLAGDFIRRTAVTAGMQQVGALTIGFAVSAAVALLSAAWAGVAALLLSLLYYLAAQHLLLADGLMVGVVTPVVIAFVTYGGLSSYRYLTEEQDRRYLRRAFEFYLHPAVIETLVRDPRALKLGGERRHLSILFADIKGFTSRAERTPPEELVAVLNTYMTAMIDVIMQSGGVVDKLMGDGIMAFWGAPASLPNPARSAVDCGLAMLGALDKLRQTAPAFADLAIGIGIATGEAIVGNFGGKQRFDYSVIGDTVNLASRIEGLTRFFEVRFLVNEQTFAEAQGEYIARTMGLVRVKGKQQPVAIVEIAGRANDSLDLSFYQNFSAAVDQLINGSQPQGWDAMRKLAESYPRDHAISLYLDKMEVAASPPVAPSSGWNSRLELSRKKPPSPPPPTQPVVFELETK
jgi:adenylate cyclase